jgi:hypothetical protein
MTIAHDSEALGVANTTAGAYTTAITPANPPNGVCVIVVGNSTSDLITSVTYGGIALTRRRFDTESTEAGAVYIYWGAAAFPSGAQNVVCNRTGTTSLRAAISTMTVTDPANFTIAVDSDATGTSASVTNPSWAMTTAAATTCCYLGIHSGLTTMTSTPAANWTLAPSPGFEDYGAQGRGWARRALSSAGAAAPGWTAATADDFVGSSIAFKEVPIAQNVVGQVAPAVAGRLVTPGREAPTIITGG